MPTAYDQLTTAYAYFNTHLFSDKLPALVIVPRVAGQRAYGYFAPNRWTENGETRHELAMNLEGQRTTREVLGTLVHEMVHVWQKEFGEYSGAYHNLEWALRMDRVGLPPSHTGQPGDKRIGQKMSHYIEEGGCFDILCADLLATGFELNWRDKGPYKATKKAGAEEGEEDAAAAKKKKNKLKYTCPICDSNVWGKPGLNIHCTDCDEPFTCQEGEA